MEPFRGIIFTPLPSTTDVILPGDSSGGGGEHQPHSSVMKLTIGVHEYNSGETVEYYPQKELMRRIKNVLRTLNNYCCIVWIF